MANYFIRKENDFIYFVELKKEFYEPKAVMYAANMFTDQCHVKVDEVDFDDGVFTDRQAEADYYNRILNMGVMPKREIIKRLFDLPDAQADEWLAEIKSETNPIGTDKTEQTFESIFGERE